MCECASMMPGETNLPLPSMICAPAGICDVRAERGNLAVTHHDRAVVDRAARHGDERRVADRDDAGGFAPPDRARAPRDTGTSAATQRRTPSTREWRRRRFTDCLQGRTRRVSRPSLHLRAELYLQPSESRGRCRRLRPRVAADRRGWRSRRPPSACPRFHR